MKRIIYFQAIFTLCVMLCGCPYKSNVPIDEPTVKVIPDLLGVWEKRTDHNIMYNVQEQDEYTYRIERTDKEKRETRYYFAYASKVNQATFLNLREKQPDLNSPMWALYRMEISSSMAITLSEVSDNITEQFSTSEELKSFISANMKNSYFFKLDKLELIRPGR